MDNLEISLIHSPYAPSYLWQILLCSQALTKDQLALQDDTSPEAEKGTLKHAYLNYLLCKHYGKPLPRKPDISKLDVDDLEDVDLVFNRVIEEYKYLRRKYARVDVYFEEEVCLDNYLPNPAWGTLDVGLVGHKANKVGGYYRGSTIEIIDAKFGRVKVDVRSKYNGKTIINPQLCAYWCGLYEKIKDEHDFIKGVFVIAQPKIHNFPSYICPADEVVDCMERVIAPAIFEAAEGKGKFNPSLSNCAHCKNAIHCKYHHEQALLLKPLVEATDMIDDKTLEESVLPNVVNLKKYCDKIIDYCIKRAEEGKKWKGFVLTSGRPTRVFTDEAKAREIAIANGYKGFVVESTLSPAQAEKLMTKPVFSELLGDLVTFKPGKNTLVAEDEGPTTQQMKKFMKSIFKETK